MIKFLKQFFCKHYFREVDSEYIGELQDWGDFDGNYNIDPTYFNEYLVDEECVFCNKKRKRIRQEFS